MLKNFSKKSPIEAANFLDMKYLLISSLSFSKNSLSVFSLPDIIIKK